MQSDMAAKSWLGLVRGEYSEGDQVTSPGRTFLTPWRSINSLQPQQSSHRGASASPVFQIKKDREPREIE